MSNTTPEVTIVKPQEVDEAAINEMVKNQPIQEATVVRTPRIEQFTASIPLPSEFRPYSFSELRVRPLRVDEVKRLRISLETMDFPAFYSILGKAMSVSPLTLTHGDFWYVAAWMRINTFPNVPYTVTWDCPSCGQSTSGTFDLDGLEVEELDEEYREPVYLTLPSGKKVQLRLYRVGDELAVRDYLKKVRKLKNLQGVNTWLEDIAQSIVDKETTLKERVAQLQDGTYTTDDVAYLDEFQGLYPHGLPDTITMSCNQIREDTEEVCGFENDQIRFRFHVLHILPSRIDRRHLKNAVVFGSESEHVSD